MEKEILNLVCCPDCHCDLIFNSAKKILICSSCKFIYKYKDGILVLISKEIEKKLRN